MEDPNNLRFLTEGVHFGFCNNFNDVFGEKSRPRGQKNGYLLNDYLVGLLTQMMPGAVLITLDKLPAGPSLNDVNGYRSRHGLDESPDASYFTLEEYPYANDPRNKNLFSWMTHKVDFTLYKYTRTESADAMSLCGDPKCPYDNQTTPFQAWKKLEDGKVVLNSCPCGYTIPLRRVRNPDYIIAED